MLPATHQKGQGQGQKKEIEIILNLGVAHPSRAVFEGNAYWR
jgi:hypothetical protein